VDHHAFPNVSVSALLTLEAGPLTMGAQPDANAGWIFRTLKRAVGGFA
jgi:hypothetical protein